MHSIHATLVTGRSTAQGLGLELGKHSEKYRHAVAACQLNPDDMKELGIEVDGLVKVSTESGSVVLRVAEQEQETPRGMVFVANGPWVNLLVSTETSGTGMPRYKGVSATVEPVSGAKVADISSLLIQEEEK